jgi:hypothetical protein
MKIPLLFFLMLFISTSYNSFAQKNEEKSLESRIGLTYSLFGEHSIVHFQELEGAQGYGGGSFYVLGVNYLSQLNKIVEFETAIEYSHHTFFVLFNDCGVLDYIPTKTSISLVNIPLTMRVNFARYFFVNGGLNLTMDPAISSSIDNQNGIGSILGFGLKYDSDFGISVFANPYFKAHCLLPFTAFTNHERLIESGVRFGIMYKLKLTDTNNQNKKYRLPCST